MSNNVIEKTEVMGGAKERIVNIPNFLTISRIFLAPIFIYAMINGKLLIALILFFIASATDLLDGFIARSFKSQTKFGKFIDPAADKFLMTIAYITLSIKHPNMIFTIPLWLTVLVIGRDLLIVSGSGILHLFNHKLVIDPLKTGKISTFAQILTIFLAILLNYLGTYSIFFHISIILTAILTVISGYLYVKVGILQLRKI